MVEAELVEVDKMTRDIEKSYWDIASRPAVFPPRSVPGGLAGGAGFGAERAAMEPVRDDLAQYKRFLKREPHGNTMDKRILAEAAAMRDANKGGPERLCIASNDMGFFAPLRLRGGRESGPIVDMIRGRFGIECGRPSAIRALCTGAQDL